MTAQVLNRENYDCNDLTSYERRMRHQRDDVLIPDNILLEIPVSIAHAI